MKKILAAIRRALANDTNVLRDFYRHGSRSCGDVFRMVK